MNIVATFNSLEEMEQFCIGFVGPKLERKAVAASEPAKQESARRRNRTVKEEPVQEPEMDRMVPEEPEAQAEEVQQAVEEPTYTLEDVRAKLGALQKAGRRDEVKQLLKSVGAEKLPEVDPKDYAALMQKAGELNA